MLQFQGAIAIFISWLITALSYGVLLGGVIWAAVGVFALIEGGILALFVRLKAYPLLVKFIVYREKFNEWLKKQSK